MSHWICLSPLLILYYFLRTFIYFKLCVHVVALCPCWPEEGVYELPSVVSLLSHLSNLLFIFKCIYLCVCVYPCVYCVCDPMCIVCFVCLCVCAWECNRVCGEVREFVGSQLSTVVMFRQGFLFLSVPSTSGQLGLELAVVPISL